MENPSGKRFLFFEDDCPELVELGQKTQAPHRFVRVVNPKVVDFWKSNAKVKALFGANRSGKTETVLIDVVWRLLGEHPFRQTKTPQYIRWLLPNYSQIEMTIRPKMERYVHSEFFKGGSWERAYDKRFNQIRFRNGSVLEFKSHQVPLLNLEGVALDCVVIDEECPYDLYQTLVMRTIDRDAQILISATPLKGLTWLWTEVWKRSDGKFIFAEQLRMEDNRALQEEAVQKVRQLIKDSRRLEGAFYDVRVFPELDDRHLTHIPDDGIYYFGFDYGYQHYSAGVVVKVCNGVVYVIDVWQEQFLSMKEAVAAFHDFVHRHGYLPMELGVYDSQLNEKDTNGEQPMVKLLEHFNAVAGTKKETHSFSVVNELLRRDLLRFNKNNPRVVSFFEKLQRYVFDEKTKKVRETEPNDDIDAMRYVVYWLCENEYLGWTFKASDEEQAGEETDFIVPTYTQRLLEKRRQRNRGSTVGYGRWVMEEV